MQIDGMMNFPLEELRAQAAELAAMPDDELRGVMAESLITQVMEVAREELKRTRQKWKRSIETADYQFETGAEIDVNDLGEHWVTFRVVFGGDYDGATAAAERWVERVETFGGIARISHVSLRGTDGTNQQWFDEEIEAGVATLDAETKARIDELMDPSRDDERLGP